jgi:integrase
MPVKIRIRSGKQYFSIIWKEGGRAKELGLGFEPEWTRELAEKELQRARDARYTRAVRGARKPSGVKPEAVKPQRVSTPDNRALPTTRQPTPKCLTFNQAFELFFDHASTYKVSWRDDRARHLHHAKASIGDLRLDQIRVATIESLKLDFQRKKLAPATQVRILAMIRVVFNHVIRLELYDGTNPVSKVRMPKVNNQRLRYLTRDEAELLLDSCDGEVHDLALLSLYSGMRLGECTGLTWDDVDLERGTITIKDAKNGSSRVVFMHSRVKEMLEARRGAVGKVFRFHKNTATHYFRRVVDDLGLNDGVTDVRYKVVFHSLRHSFASWAAEQGASIPVLMNLMGHKSVAMTMRYSHLSDSALREAVNGL